MRYHQEAGGSAAKDPLGAAAFCVVLRLGETVPAAHAHPHSSTTLALHG